MAMVGKLCVGFDGNLETVAYCAEDSLLRIWETNTSRIKHEYLPSEHLRSSCTCLKWRPKLDPPGRPSVKKGKNSKTQTPGIQDDHDIIAFGTVTGAIYLYNITKGIIQAQLDSQHNGPVSDLCWSEDGLNLFSCSTDGLIVQWDIRTAKYIKKWQSPKSSLTSLSLCGPSHLIAAGRSVAIWNIESQEEEKVFVGHSTDILQTHSFFVDLSDKVVDNVFIITVARGDRVVSVWSPSSKSSKSKQAVCSFILSDEPKGSALFYDPDRKSTQLAVITTGNTVEMFTNQINGNIKKPMKPKFCIKVTTPTGKSQAILACGFRSSNELLLMYGTAVCANFHVLNLTDITDFDITIQKEDPSHSVSITQATSVGTIKQPKADGDVVTLTPASAGTKKSSKKSRSDAEKRPSEKAELSIEERLVLLQGNAETKSSGTGPVDSLTNLLTQGLQSDDSTILMKVLQTNDPKIINTTVSRLPVTCVLPLVTHLTKRLESYGSSGKGSATINTSLVKWIRALFIIHASHLATFPELMDRLRGMYAIMENRVGQFTSFTRLQGRLELMLSQLARQKDDERSSEPTAALLTLQDESSEDEAMDDLDMLGGNISESEDGYLSGDGSDLVK